MYLKHHADIEWDDLEKIEEPFFACAHLERNFHDPMRWIHGINEIQSELGFSQLGYHHPSLLKQVLHTVECGDRFLVHSFVGDPFFPAVVWVPENPSLEASSSQGASPHSSISSNNTSSHNSSFSKTPSASNQKGHWKISDKGSLLFQARLEWIISRVYPKQAAGSQNDSAPAVSYAHVTKSSSELHSAKPIKAGTGGQKKRAHQVHSNLSIKPDKISSELDDRKVGEKSTGDQAPSEAVVPDKILKEINDIKTLRANDPEARVKQLAWDPDSGKFRTNEAQTAFDIEGQFGYFGRYQRPSPKAPKGDFISLSGTYKGQTFDDFGSQINEGMIKQLQRKPVKTERKFFESLENHLQQSDNVILNLSVLKAKNNQLYLKSLD